MVIYVHAVCQDCFGDSCRLGEQQATPACIAVFKSSYAGMCISETTRWE